MDPCCQFKDGWDYGIKGVVKMAINWAAVEKQKGMSTDDQIAYYKNKKIWDNETDKNSEAAQKANAENVFLRSKYNMGADGYGADDAEGAFKYNSQSGNPYIHKADNIDFNVDRSGLDKAKADVENFKYNPETDETFKLWRQQYQKESDSAAKSTINQLNAASMGRNNTFSAATTAQVQQAYAQKLSDKALDLANEAYQKLLDKHNMERADYEDRYNKQQDNYNRNIDMADRQFNRWVNTEQHEQNMEVGDLQKQMLEVDSQYYPKEKEVAYQSGVKQNKLLDKEIQWYDPKAQAEIDATNSGIAVNNAQIESINQETAMNYAAINNALGFLESKGLVDANGNCTLVNGDKKITLSKQEVAAGIASGTIGMNEDGTLGYIGG